MVGIHLELAFKKSDGRIVKAIGFFMTTDSWSDANLNIGHHIDLVAAVEKSTFRNFPELRLRIIDLRASQLMC